jgi:DNA-binding GntR family transcriptional regulator
MTSNLDQKTRTPRDAAPPTAGPHDDPAASKRISLADRIRQSIASGTHKSGDWLRLTDLEQRYGAKRSEARKALAELAATKTLEHIENYGYRVVLIDRRRDDDTREVRFILEVAAAKLSIERATDAEIAALADLADRFEWAVKNETVAEIDTANHAFHRALNATCGNPVLAQAIDDVRTVVRLTAQSPWSTFRGMLQSAEEHHTMVAALRNRDTEALIAVLRAHIHKWAPRAAG